MRFLSFAKGDTPSAKTSWGAITDKGIIDLGSRMHCDFKQALTSGRLEEAKLLAAELSPDTDVADIIYLPPVANPEKIACIGVNYANRNARFTGCTRRQPAPSA